MRGPLKITFKLQCAISPSHLCKSLILLRSGSPVVATILIRFCRNFGSSMETIARRSSRVHRTDRFQKQTARPAILRIGSSGRLRESSRRIPREACPPSRRSLRLGFGGYRRHQTNEFDQDRRMIPYARFPIGTTLPSLRGTRDTTAALARSSKAVAMYFA